MPDELVPTATKNYLVTDIGTGGKDAPTLDSDKHFELAKAAGRRDLISDWIGDGEEEGHPIRTNMDLSGVRGMAIATKLLLESEHDNSKLDGQEFTITGVMITAGKSIDNQSGEIKIWPRTAILCKDGTHLVFGGIVALRSVLLLMAHLGPEEWLAGIKVKVHASKSKPGGVMHRLEVIP